MIGSSATLISSGFVSGKLWLAAGASHLCTFTLAVFLDDSLFPALTGGLQAALTVVVLSGFIGIIVTAWKLTRALAQTAETERGFVGSWIGWAMVASLPCLFVVAGFGIWDENAAYWWLESLSMSLVTALVAPILVHSTGRAINDNGPSLGFICDYWLDSYSRVFVAYLVAVAPFMLAADGFYMLVPTAQIGAVLIAFASTFFSFASTVFAIAVTVTAYREAEAARSTGAA